MSKGRRRAVVLSSTLLLALILAAIALGWRWLALSGRPQRSGSSAIPGLASSVRVRFDEAAVPHLDAASALDLAAAMGWLHANERLFQMELGRRTAAGRLSELFGEATLRFDESFLRLRLRETAEEEAASCSEQTRAWMEAYARGVNAWIRERGSDLPPELRLLGARPEPWRPVDSFGIGLLFNWDLSLLAWRCDELRFAWMARLGEERARDLSGADLELAPEIDLASYPWREGALLEPPAVQGGSNNWVLGPSRTASHRPIVANDPHLELGLPSVWYQVRMRSSDYAAAGMTIPGLPMIVLGQNEHVAWAVTNSGLDDHDYFLERLDEEGNAVERDGEWRPIEREELEIRLRGGTSHSFQRSRTDIGPLLPSDERLGVPVRSLSWAGYRGGDRSAAFLGMAQARSVEEAFERIGGYASPAQNLLIADAKGEICIALLGAVPDRPRGDGRLPLPGWASSYRWKAGSMRGEHLQSCDPAEGFLSSANNKPAAYALDVSAEFDTPHRANRIDQRLAERSDWDPSSVAAVQSDVVSRFALEVVALLAPSREAFTGDEARAFAALESWNGAMEGRGAAALFLLLEQALHDCIFGDELSEAALPPLFGPTRRFALLGVLAGSCKADWLDDVSTPERETGQQTIARALASAWSEGKRRFGADLESWDHGAMHQLELRHPLREIPLLGRLWSRGPFEVAGSRTSICAWYGGWREDRVNVAAGPSMRWVADVGDPDRSLAALPGGQSGHPYDPRFDDQLEPFLRGQMRAVRWSEKAVAEHAVSELLLLPAPGSQTEAQLGSQ